MSDKHRLSRFHPISSATNCCILSGKVLVHICQNREFINFIQHRKWNQTEQNQSEILESILAFDIEQPRMRGRRS